MLFNSQHFILLFLPITLLLFLLLWAKAGRKPALGWLVIASLFFYGWWNPLYLPILTGSILANFLLVRGMTHTKRRSRRRFALLTLGIIFNLGLLAYFKYSGFLLGNLGALVGNSFSVTAVTLPLAISFYTFQQISYLVDVWRNRGREYDFLHYATYVSFFPQLIAGPIVRHHELIPQFKQDPLREGLWERIGRGSLLFAIGLLKKVMIADGMGQIVDPAFAAAAAGEVLSFQDAWLAAFAFSWQIYFDFSGYSDMAIGLALMFGYRLPVNFDTPYRASSLQGLWQHWHMTLTRFLRDYLFVTLARLQHLPHAAVPAVLITMFLGGLWHGANWTFAVWGLAHGAALLCNAAFTRSGLGLPKGLGWLLTLWFWVEITVLFRADSFTTAAVFWNAMHNIQSLNLALDPGEFAAVLGAGVIAIVGPNSQKVALERQAPGLGYALATGLAIAAMLVLIGDTGTEFYYFQF